jgi:hypothetical protein
MLRSLLARARVEQREFLFPADRRGCLPSRHQVRNIAGEGVRSNGRDGLALPVPTSRSIPMLRHRSLRRCGQPQPGVRVSPVPCIRPRRAPPRADNLLREHRRKVAPSMAGHSRR